MGEKFDRLSAVVTGSFVSFIVYLVGGVDHLFTAALVFIGIDICTGIVLSIYQNNFTSRSLWWGMVRKSFLLYFVIIANQLDLIMGNSEGFLREAALMFILGIEGVSILENLGRLGLPVPKFLVTVLRKLQDVEKKDLEK